MKDVSRSVHVLVGVLLVGVLAFLASLESVIADDNIHVFDNLAKEKAGAYVPGEVLLSYKNDTERFRVMKVPDVQKAIEALQRNPNVKYAEPNYIASIAHVPNDPFYATYQWNLHDADGGVYAELAWDISTGVDNTGNGVVVAVIDTGVAYENYTSGRGKSRQSYYLAPDLADTCFMAGYDFVNNDSHPNDDHSHGTHVAGTVAQSTNNALGVAGLAYDACVMPVKVMDSNGSGAYSDIVNGVYFAADNGADVITMSLGGGSGSTVMRDALAYAYNKGVTIVVAAGNDNGAVSYPAAYDDYVIAVGATRFDEVRAPYSNYGSSLDIVAPGGDTTVDQNNDGYNDGVLQQTFNSVTKNTNDFGYYFFQGTSMATPHVAAAAALVIANGNAINPDDVREALQSTAKDLGATGLDNYFGHGLLNVANALAWTAGPVDVPPSVSIASPTNGDVLRDMVSVAITGSFYDDVGVASLNLTIDGNKVLVSTSSDTYSYDWDLSLAAEGGHVITVTIVDTAGQVTQEEIVVTVDNVNDAPVAVTGGNESHEVLTGEKVSVTLSGADSFDPNDDALTYLWSGGNISVPTTTQVFVTELGVGVHEFILEVSDTELSDSTTVTITVSEVTVPEITLTANGYILRKRMTTDLTWSGATGSNVDVYRNGNRITTTNNDGFYTNKIGRGTGTFVYQICEVSSTVCSSEETVVFQ